MILTFGKWKGYEIKDVPSWYLKSVAATITTLTPEEKAEVEAELLIRNEQGPSPADPGRPSAAGTSSRSTKWASPGWSSGPARPSEGPGRSIEQVVTLWYRKMIYQHHPDRGGSTEAAQIINEAYECLRELAGMKRPAVGSA